MEELKINEKENVKATQNKTEEKTEKNLEKKTEILMETNLKNKNSNFKEPKMCGTPEKETTKNYLQTKDDIWWLVFLSLTMLGIISRLHYITMPFSVVWDETHFGKMASWYLNRTFFFDVHPPGGKLLIALFGYLSNYNGTFPFNTPGDSYEGYDEIMYMRLGCALLGAGIVPLSFLTVWELSRSLMASSFSGLFCIYEIGLLTLSKFILLDPILMFYMMASFHGLCMFNRENITSPWSRKWWIALLYTGISLGCTISIKFVGVFIIIVVGLYTVCDLWDIFSDISNSLTKIFQHFMARAFCLIFVPVLIYIAIFFVHDQVLIYSHHSELFQDGLGLSSFSSEFQKRLINSSLYNIKQPAEMSYGSVVTLKNDGLGGGYLHSHNFTYPEKYVKGNLQQVTTLKGKDVNNYFRVLFPMDDPDMVDGFYFGEPEAVMHNNWIRLHHLHTNATVACHKNKSIVATKLNLVYAIPYNLSLPTYYTEETDDDITKKFSEQFWNVKIKDGGENEPVKTLQTKFQLISPKFHCALTWSKESLSHVWGFSQGEAACTKNLKDPYSFWKIETVTNPHADNSSFDNITISFLERLAESHQVMTFINARLKPVDNFDNLDRPWMWPILYKSAPWYDVQFRIVLLGNPLLFLLNFVSLIVTPILLVIRHYKHCRDTNVKEKESREDMDFIFAIRWTFIAYLIHYLPFFTMQRILYFHHYFPAQAFACMLTAILFSKSLESFSRKFSNGKKIFVLRGCILLATVLFTLSFLMYCYVAYGHPTTGPFALHNSTFKRIRFNDDWLI